MLKKKCLINLDWLFELKKRQEKSDPVEVIDKMLVNERSKRTLQGKPARFNEFVLGQEPSGGCPKCRLYVEDGCNGVLCTGCQAYWHYECAGVNDEILENEWNGVEFQCSLHKTTVIHSLSIHL